MDGFYDYWAGYDQASRNIGRFGFDAAVLLMKLGAYCDRSDDWALGYCDRLFEAFEEKRVGEA